MRVQSIQNNNTNFCGFYRQQKRISKQDLMNIWYFSDYNDFVSQQPAKKLPNILVAHAKQFRNMYFNNCFDIEQAKREISKSFVNLLLGK